MSQTLEQPSTDPTHSLPQDELDASTAELNRESNQRTIHKLLGMIPSIFVFASLAGLGFYGHHNDWKLPSSLAGESTASTSPVWCESHSVPEDQCIACTPGLVEEAPFLTFCVEHGVHGCVHCEPELAQTKTPYVPTEDELKRIDHVLKLRPRQENLSISTSPGTRIQFASIEAMNKAGVDVEPVTRDRVVEFVAAAAKFATTKPSLPSFPRSRMVW